MRCSGHAGAQRPASGIEINRHAKYLLGALVFRLQVPRGEFPDIRDVADAPRESAIAVGVRADGDFLADLEVPSMSELT